MANVKVVMNHAGVEALLSDSAVTSDLLARAERVKASADAMDGCDYAVTARPGRQGGRPYVAVAANNAKARAKNAKHNTLLKSLDAGR